MSGIQRTPWLSALLLSYSEVGHAPIDKATLLEIAEWARDLEAKLEAMELILEDIIPLAAKAMREVNDDGGEYDIKAELADARLALASLQQQEELSQ